MSVQTVTTQNIRRSLAGILEGFQEMEKGSFLAEDALIGYGKPVVRGTDPERQAKLPSADTDVLLGITIRDLAIENTSVGSNLSEYSEGDVMSVLREGSINVVAEEAVVPGDPVYFYHTANAGKVPGDFVKAPDATFTTLIPGATWELTQATVGGLSVIRLKS